ncbi:uroporphyrinogen decarboxylase [Candidatus Vecturithrix granuli]|uniref:Uroporphyrinogen decarboxylase n=1 Tax=Vecturithrix granuli TaxID=1499967 RepID=A0A0S6W5T6_VECG1|nr:uroporphyrinogen decarboxylase [Candidatus Vecturithrix granuli]
MITGIERLNAAIKGEILDRIPVFCNLVDQGAKELGMSLQEYYAKGEYVAEGQIRMREKYGYDNVWSLFYVGKEAELLGCRKILFAQDGPPNVQDFVIKSYEDIPKLQIPDNIIDHPAFQEELTCLRLLKAEVGGKYSIVAYITSSMTLPVLLMGMEKWLELLLWGPPDLRDELLSKCHEFFTREMAAYRKAGADALVYSNPFGSTDTIPLKFFREHALPWIEKDVNAVGAEGLVYYCGTSRMNAVLDVVIERTGITAYNLSPFDDVVEGKRIIAGRALTVGILNDLKLIDWSHDEIRCEVKRILEAGMPGGKFVFGTMGMPYCIPEENINTMLEAAYEFGSLRPQECESSAFAVKAEL